MTRITLVFPALVGLALLSGCDIADKIPLTPREALRAADKFGTATREKVEETEEGTIYRVMVESRRPATWIDARRPIWRDLGSECPDGQHAQGLSAEPLNRGSAEDATRIHPAGTVFVRTLRCAPQPDFEFVLGDAITQDEAQNLMYQRLSEFPPTDSGQAMVMPLFFSKNHPKYPQVQQTLGIFIYSRIDSCPTGVAVRNLMLGTITGQTEAAMANDPNGYLGFITECVGAKPVEISLEPG